MYVKVRELEHFLIVSTQPRETFVWRSRNFCLRVEKFFSESRETFVWESRNFFLTVE